MNPRRECGPLVSRRVAADLSGIDPARLDRLIATGEVRTERLNGATLVSLDDAERAAGKGPDL